MGEIRALLNRPEFNRLTYISRGADTYIVQKGTGKGWGVTFVTGNFFLGPNSKKLEAAIEEKGATDPEALRLTGVLLNVARVDSLVLTLVIVDMVIKPT